MTAERPKKRSEIEAELTERALKDEAFRRALIDDPKGTLQRELNVQFPEVVSISVVEETPTNRYIVLPTRPPSADRELSDAELEAAAGGEGGYSYEDFMCTLDAACQY